MTTNAYDRTYNIVGKPLPTFLVNAGVRGLQITQHDVLTDIDSVASLIRDLVALADGEITAERIFGK